MTAPVIWTSFVDVVNNVWNLDLSRCFLTSGLDGRTNDRSKMNKIQGLIDKYKSTCTVPKHPKACPECGAKVGVYHLNYSEAVFMCSNEECVWPLVTHDPEEILGKSDVATLVKIKVEKEAQNDTDLSDSFVSDDDDQVCNQELPLTKSSISESSSKKTSNSIHSLPSVEPKSLSTVRNDALQDSSKTERKEQNTISADQTIAEGKVNTLDNQELFELDNPTKELTNDKDECHEGGSDQELDSDHGQDPESSDSEQDSEPNVPQDTNDEKEKEAATVPMENKDSSFEETLEMPPQLMSPIPPSPATPLQAKTPFRDDDDDEFIRPSSAIGTPRRGLATPLHLPIPISPLPPTPQRGSERSINLDYDLQLTDSEWSDVENTPRHAPKCSEDLDMPKLFASPKPKLKHSYSKDLDRIVENDNSITGTPMKLKLKRQSGHDWNVENSPKDDGTDSPEGAMKVLPDRPAVSGKLDKVVLNLKKSVTGNTWNVAEKNPSQAADVQATQNSCGVTATAPCESLGMNAPRRGRKSKVAPMKIQNVQALAKEPENGPDEQSVNLKSNVPMVIESPSVQNSPPRELLPSSPLVTNTIENVDELREKIDLPSPATTKSIFDEDAFEKPDLSLREKPNVKTFSRKKRPLTKKAPTTNFNDDMNWTEVAELSSRAANAFQQKNDFNEFCQLMKAATGENQVGLNFIQKVQKKLCITHGNSARSQVTFHVGQNKANIDLPTEESSMAVNDSSSAVQVMLSSESDGIVGDVLKVKEPAPQIVQDHRKRGRPSKPRMPTPPSPPPTMVPSPMTNMGQQFFISAAENSQDFLTPAPATINQFKRHLDQLMESYQPPPDLPPYVDPFIAMMVTRAREPAYQSINFPAMLFFYEQITRSESCQPRQSSGAAISGAQDYTSSCPAVGNERSYAELQTVRGGGQVTDANQVLLQHQLNASHEEDVPDTSVLVSENHCQSHLQDQQQQQQQQQQQHSQQQSLVIKQEAMTPPQFHDNAVGSVRLLSVRPNQNPKSVQEYSQGKIGRGQKCVQFTYKNSNFGPLYVDTENEIKAIVALTQEKIKEREYRDKHGGRRSTGVTPASEATSARSILPKEIVEYIDKAFTKKGMKENIIGRKKRNYPKRSKVIKEDPVTKELILPNGDRMINTSTIKKDFEPLHHNTVPALPPPPLPNEENLDDDPLAFEDPNADEDLPNPLNKDELLILPKSPPKPTKISSSLFKKRKNKKTSPDKAKAEHAEMIDNILTNHEFEKTQQNGNASGYHGIGTRQQTSESSTLVSSSSSATSNKNFDPTVLFEQTFIRKEQTEKVKRLLEKKKKKEERREQRKALKRSQKYAGIGLTPKNEAKRFKKAPQPIDGRKMVIKESGDIVQVNKAVDVQGSSKDNNVTQGELDFVDQLIRMGEQAFCSESNQIESATETATTLDFNPTTSSQTTRHSLPDFDYHFDSVQEKDFSYDDIFD